jgi:PilZ domain
MNVTITYNMKSESSIFGKLSLSMNRSFYKAETQKEAYMYHIEHVNVDSYIVNPTGMNAGQLKSIVEHIQYLNAIITIIIFKPAFELPSGLLNKKNIKIAGNDDEILEFLKEINQILRDSNRVQWPLNVEYWIPDNKKGSLKKARVLSLSSSGCFIGTDPLLPLKKGESLSMIFSFKDFDFYSDGNVVRVSSETDATKGIAVEFKDVSSQTQKCIGEIIDEKILSQIMDAIK